MTYLCKIKNKISFELLYKYVPHIENPKNATTNAKKLDDTAG